MRILLGKPGEIPDDVTDRVFNEDFDITQERERAVFQRVHSDVSLKFSNMDGYFSKLFLSNPSNTHWELTIVTTRPIFWGEIDNSSTVFTVDQEELKITAFSKTKLFWDWARATKILPGEYAPALQVASNVQDIIEYNLIGNEELPSGLFEGVDVHSSLVEDLGVINAYYTLVKETTIEQLFTAFAIHFNAEWYIDPATHFIKFYPRLYVDNDIEKEISDIIVDGTVDHQISDGNKKDYIKTTSMVPVPSISLEETLVLGSDNSGGVDLLINHIFVFFRVTAVLPDGIETGGSNIIALPQMSPDTWFRTVLRVDPYPEAIGYNVYILKFRIIDPNPNIWKRIWPTVPASYDTSYTPQTSDPTLPILWNCERVIGGYAPLDINVDTLPDWDGVLSYPYCYSIDETTGEFIKSVVASGEPLEILPQLSFNVPYVTVENFFKEIDINERLTRWQNILINKSQLRSTIRDTDIRLGDSIKCSNLPMGSARKFVVRKAMQKPISELSEIIAVSV
jgi:hypothetical protein